MWLYILIAVKKKTDSIDTERTAETLKVCLYDTSPVKTDRIWSVEELDCAQTESTSKDSLQTIGDWSPSIKNPEYMNISTISKWTDLKKNYSYL